MLIGVYGCIGDLAPIQRSHFRQRHLSGVIEPIVVRGKLLRKDAPLNTLNEPLARYAGVRNEIVHHHSIKDDALRRLDMYFLPERWGKLSEEDRPVDVKELIKTRIFEVLWFKKRELIAFNDGMATGVSLILDKLASYYLREENTLRLRLSKPTQ